MERSCRNLNGNPNGLKRMNILIRNLILCVAVLSIGACAEEREAETSAGDGSSSEPETVPFGKGPYEVRVERSHFVPMRDGVRLSTDLYFPVGAEGKLPVILERTPYDKGSKRTPTRTRPSRRRTRRTTTRATATYSPCRIGAASSNRKVTTWC